MFSVRSGSGLVTQWNRADDWLAMFPKYYRVSDEELRLVFRHVLKPETGDDKFRLALQLFATMEAR